MKMNMKGIYRGYENIAMKICNLFASFPMILCSVVAYKLFLDVMYCIYIEGIYTYFYLEISLLNVISGWIVTLIMAPVINIYCKQKTSSAIMMIALNMVYFIPLTTYCGYGGGSSSFLMFAIIYWVIMSLLQVKIPIVTYKFKSKEISDRAFYIVTVLATILVIYIWAKYSHFRILTDIINVYEVRSEAAKYSIPTILAYLRQLSTIVIPLLILIALNRKKYIIFVGLIFLTVINFSYAGNKVIILFPIILVGGYIFYRRDMIKLIFPMGILMEILAFIEQFLGSNYITSLLFRRQGVMLAQLSEDYYRFFLNNPTDIFRGTVLGKLGFDGVYTLPIGKVIGNNFETQVVNCNNGMLADVWANLGIMGLVAMPIILIICFRLLDMATYGVDTRFTIGLALYYTIAFANSSWSTVMLTHGFLVVCLVFFIFPRTNREIGDWHENHRSVI